MLEHCSKSVRIVEVGPRDGLQNEQKILSTKDKFSFIEKLIDSGVSSIEATSFVRAPKIPQMADAEELFYLINQNRDFDRVTFSALVPNVKGLEAAIKSGVKEIAVFTATSDEFNQKNINATVEESLERISLVCKAAKKEKIKIRGYVSTAFGCPYGGDDSIQSTIKVSTKLFEMGAYEVSIGDTIGSATPKRVIELVKALKENFPQDTIAMHFHDTKKMALANILTSFEEGITVFDSSTGGLGGCPYAIGSSGNVATELLVYLFDSLGVETGIDLGRLEETSSWVKKLIS